MEGLMDNNRISAVAMLCVLVMSCFWWGRSSLSTTTVLSRLETVDIQSKARTVVYVAPEHFEAPNWTRDGAFFLFNQDGRLYRLPVTGGKPAVIDTGFAIRCNNDHGISPDSKFIAISDQSQGDHNSILYTVPFGGGAPHRITQNSPSYWHGWSPDGSTLAFVGERNGDLANHGRRTG
jgi:dipeptidyl aminopeptidase/acylaminoacyl peptidase